MDHSSPQLAHRPSLTSNLPKLTLPASTEPPSATHPPKQQVWLIFGATGHLGRSLVKAALGHNDVVCAVGRTFEDSLSSMQNWQHCQVHASNFYGLLCDIRVRSTVADVISKCIKRFKRIDVIANCAGHGVIGACEDQDEDEIRGQFETNFMGTLNIIQLSLPHLRQNGHGRYIMMSSTSGALGVPGLGPYCASKYAVEGLIESMLYEVDQFGIRATLVEPGHLRRDDVNNELSSTTGKGTADGKGELPIFGHFRVKAASAPYKTKDAPAAHAKRILAWMGDNQPVSAVRSAELIWQLAHCSYPPLRLLLGMYAVESIRDRLKCITEEIEDWKHLHFPAVEGMEQPADDGDVEMGDEGADKEDEEEENGDGNEDADEQDDEDESVEKASGTVIEGLDDLKKAVN